MTKKYILKQMQSGAELVMEHTGRMEHVYLIMPSGRKINTKVHFYESLKKQCVRKSWGENKVVLVLKGGQKII